MIADHRPPRAPWTGFWVGFGPISGIRHVIRIFALGLALSLAVASLVVAPMAQAEDSDTYEIVSTQSDVPAANVEYNANSERKALQ